MTLIETIDKYNKDFDDNCKTIDSERYIDYSLLLEIIDFISMNYNDIAALDEYKKLSTRLLSILLNLEFKEGLDIPIEKRLYSGQLTLNGVGVFESALIAHYEDYLKPLGGNEYDHTCMHTGKGFGEPDFEVKKDFTLVKVDKNDGSGIVNIVLDAGTTIDAKTYKSYDSMVAAVRNNTNGALGHFGDCLLMYVFETKKYYFASNTHSFMPIEVESLNVSFDYPFFSLRLENGVLKAFAQEY